MKKRKRIKVICDGAKECGMSFRQSCLHAIPHTKRKDCVVNVLGKKTEKIYCFRVKRETECLPSV